MAFRSRRRSFSNRNVRRTNWAEGTELNFHEFFTMSPRLSADAVPVIISYLHVVQLTGPEILQDQGGEGAVIIRTLGNVEPQIMLFAQDQYYWHPEGAAIMQSIQSIEVPEGTALQVAPQLIAAALHTEDGLGAENVLWSRRHRQLTTQGLGDILAQYINSPVTVTTGFGNDLVTGFRSSHNRNDRDFEFDVTAKRRIETNKHLYMITEVVPLQTITMYATPPVIRYDGYVRLLAKRSS